MLKQSILLAIASGFLTSLCPVFADTNDKSRLVDQPNMLNATPLTLVPATDELYTKLTKEQQTEKEEILLLFRLALMKSEDVRNLLKKMYPTGDKVGAESFLNSLVSVAKVEEVTMNLNAGFSVSSQLLALAAEKAKYKMTDQERSEFLRSVRPLFADVVGQYRDYKIKHKQLHIANEDFEDLKKMFADAKNMDASKQIEMEYTLRKQQKDIDEIGKTLKEYRQFLAELTSEDAVQKIDNNLIGEYNKAELNKFPPSKGKISESSAEPHSESAQFQVLWKATLENSPDINFVLAKLAPSADSSKWATVLFKSGGKDGTASDTSLNQNLSFNIFSQLLDSPENVRNKKAKLSQEEQMMFYNMIRTTAKQLISAYRDYKLAKDEPSKSKCRQILVDLAGNEAVDKLDKMSQLEQR